MIAEHIKNLKKYNSVWLLATLIIYLIINNIFIVKYVSRAESLNAYLFSFIYTIFVLVVLFFYRKINLSEDLYKVLFYFSIGVFFVFAIMLNQYVDGNALNVDRWSALDYAIRDLLSNKYPYTAGTHLDGRTSNLPSLIFIGLPFYLLGDVGYLQVFSFLVFAWIVNKYVKHYKYRFLTIVLLCISPSYLWELYVKSDLISNAIFLFWFLLESQQWMRRRTNTDIIVISFLTVAMVLTRLVVIIPLVLMLSRFLLDLDLKQKAIFILTGLLVMTVFLSTCFYNYGSLDNLIAFNPVNLQNRQLPLWLSALCILVPLIYSFLKDIKGRLIAYSLLFSLIPVVLAFAIKVYEYGFMDTLFESGFDISYFNFILPLLLYLIASELSKKSKQYAFIKGS